MTDRTRHLATWLTLVSVFMWSSGLCCCIAGPGCDSSEMAKAQSESSCCSQESSEPGGNQEQSRVCGCDAEDDPVTLSVDTAVRIDTASPAIEDPIEHATRLSSASRTYDAIIPPSPHQRGPPESTGLFVL